MEHFGQEDDEESLSLRALETLRELSRHIENAVAYLRSYTQEVAYRQDQAVLGSAGLERPVMTIHAEHADAAKSYFGSINHATAQLARELDVSWDPEPHGDSLMRGRSTLAGDGAWATPISSLKCAPYSEAHWNFDTGRPSPLAYPGS